MPKKHRLTGAQIRRLKPEKRLNSSLFSLSATRTDSETTQIACVVSKKVSAKAVVRNQAKRRMRMALKHATLPSHLSIILTAKKAVVNTSYALIRDDVSALVEKLRGGK